MTQQVSVDPADVAATQAGDGTLEAAPGVAYRRLMFVNVAYLGQPGQPDWVLVDTGIPGMADSIAASAAERFADVPPRAIVLTHGHFDHVGTLETLANRWDVPVYAHTFERPYPGRLGILSQGRPDRGWRNDGIVVAALSAQPGEHRPSAA